MMKHVCGFSVDGLVKLIGVIGGIVLVGIFVYGIFVKGSW